MNELMTEKKGELYGRKSRTTDRKVFISRLSKFRTMRINGYET